MTRYFSRMPLFVLATVVWTMTLWVANASAQQDASAQQPVRIKNGDVISGELLAMKGRANGKRVLTFQLTAGPHRLPDPGGLCNLENGPETFQLVTRSDAEVGELKRLVGKKISIKANDITCSESAGQNSDAMISKWSAVKQN
jgi:hypothetical protein